MSESILNSTKKLLGLEADYTPFDMDIKIHINSVFLTLQQIGLGPQSGFMVQDDTEVWSDFISGEYPLNAVKTYMYLRVRMLFDPPTTSHMIAAMNEQIKELEWRLNVLREGVVHPSTAKPENVLFDPGNAYGGLVISGGTPANTGGV